MNQIKIFRSDCIRGDLLDNLLSIMPTEGWLIEKIVIVTCKSVLHC